MAKKKDKSQTLALLEHLQANGTITSMEAFRLYGITRLSALIFDLRKDGYVINTEMIKHEKNRFNNRMHYAKYILIKEDK